MADIVKFKKDSPFHGYGFDLDADRVIRFNKHPDGTYLNTRATYSINQSAFTHNHLRRSALAEWVNDCDESDEKTSNSNWLFKFLVILILIKLLTVVNVQLKKNSDFNFEFTTSVSTSELPPK